MGTYESISLLDSIKFVRAMKRKLKIKKIYGEEVSVLQKGISR